MKGIAGFYYVDVEESGIYECKAKGIFRKDSARNRSSETLWKSRFWMKRKKQEI